MSTYDFQNIRISILDAFNNYMKTNNAPLFVGAGFSGTTVTVSTSAALTAAQLTTMTTLVNGYVEPAYYLNFSRTESTALHSHYTCETDLIQDTGGNKIVQTLIFTNRNTPNGEVLDCLKTVIEYNTPNVQNFLNTTSGSATFQIYDITRNYLISNQTIDISNIATQWNTLALTGSTQGNTVYQTNVCAGLLGKSTTYDCVWQYKMNTSSPLFNVRMNGLQYIFSNQEMSTLV